MSAQTVSIFKFVGTISLGLLTGISATLTTTTLPTFLALPTAQTARSALTSLSSRTRTLSTYLRHITAFTLFSAYLLSPKSFRHPYLVYTSLFAFASGVGVDAVMGVKSVKEGEEEVVHVEKAEEVNGEMVGTEVERMKRVEGVRSVVSGLGFMMAVVGIWGDGA
ncbi:hypothetical protein M011DRAFT_455301 [Sporormia fimetaria CBS 119925]|uniref:Uncharacterized protein n=1 Tax=Sporormia fimetaria CBS 119925 TaxID=1340428 RepID=A0A6A6VKW0_9PLEO|nr:hypothetical protein M011DRAFT_455301 [Sporormia fimetaria CBS 119925]